MSSLQQLMSGARMLSCILPVVSFVTASNESVSMRIFRKSRSHAISRPNLMACSSACKAIPGPSLDVKPKHQSPLLSLHNPPATESPGAPNAEPSTLSFTNSGCGGVHPSCNCSYYCRVVPG